VSLAVVAGIIAFYRHVLHGKPDDRRNCLFCWPFLAVFPPVWGMAVSVFMSVLAMLSFNYFFLPPVGTFTVTDPQKLGGVIGFSADIDHG